MLPRQNHLRFLLLRKPCICFLFLSFLVLLRVIFRVLFFLGCRSLLLPPSLPLPCAALAAACATLSFFRRRFRSFSCCSSCSFVNGGNGKLGKLVRNGELGKLVRNGELGKLVRNGNGVCDPCESENVEYGVGGC